MVYVLSAYLGVLSLAFTSAPFTPLLGFAAPLFLLKKDDEGKEPGLLDDLFGYLSVVGFLPAIAIAANVIIFRYIAGKFYFPSPKMAIIYAVIVAMSFIAVLAFLRYVPQALNKAKGKLTKRNELERNRKIDIRKIDDHLPAPLEFDPTKYFDLKQGIFLGLDEGARPVYIEMGNNNNVPHIEVVGTTGAGKGVSFGVISSQFAARGEAVFFCDPKNDEWAPHVLYAAAKRLNVPFHFINLNAPNGPQFNIFEGGTKEEIFEMLTGAFSLTERGSAADFYGIADRRAAKRAAEILAAGGTAAAVHERFGDDFHNEAEKFAGKFREMAETASINAIRGGVDFSSIVRGGGIVYIVGSMRNDIIKTIQRMLLIRFIQLAERRDRMAGQLRPVCIILDELKYHISRPTLEALGAARDKGVHLVMAHQSLGDLEDCPADINPKAVVDGVIENCRIKICYKVENPATAEWFAMQTGKILVDDESRNVRRNAAQAEIVESSRTIRQDDRFYIDEQVLKSLKPKTCVFLGQGLAKAMTINPIPTIKSADAIAIKVVESNAQAAAEELEMPASPAEQSLALDDFPLDIEADQEPQPEPDDGHEEAVSRSGFLDLDDTPI